MVRYPLGDRPHLDLADDDDVVRCAAALVAAAADAVAAAGVATLAVAEDVDVVPAAVAAVMMAVDEAFTAAVDLAWTLGGRALTGDPGTRTIVIDRQSSLDEEADDARDRRTRNRESAERERGEKEREHSGVGSRTAAPVAGVAAWRQPDQLE